MLVPKIPLSMSKIALTSFLVRLDVLLGSPSGMVLLARAIAWAVMADGERPKQLEPVASVNWFAAGVPGGHLIFPSSSIMTPNRAAARPARLPPRLSLPIVLPRLFSCISSDMFSSISSETSGFMSKVFPNLVRSNSTSVSSIGSSVRVFILYLDILILGFDSIFFTICSGVGISCLSTKPKFGTLLDDCLNCCEGKSFNTFPGAHFSSGIYLKPSRSSSIPGTPPLFTLLTPSVSPESFEESPIEAMPALMADLTAMSASRTDIAEFSIRLRLKSTAESIKLLRPDIGVKILGDV